MASSRHRARRGGRGNGGRGKGRGEHLRGSTVRRAGPVGTATGADEPETAGSVGGTRRREEGMGQLRSGAVASGAAVSPSSRLVARRGVSAEPPSGRFRGIRPIVVPTGPRAPDRTRAGRSPAATSAAQQRPALVAVRGPLQSRPRREEPSSERKDVPHPLIRSPSFCMHAAGSRGLTSVPERPCPTAVPAGVRTQTGAALRHKSPPVRPFRARGRGASLVSLASFGE